MFSEATSSYVHSLGPYQSLLLVRKSALASRLTDDIAFSDERLVIARTILPHRLSRGYGNPASQVLDTVNGKAIRNLAHLVALLRDCRDPFVEFQFADRFSETMVFEREKLVAAIEDILSDNGIRTICSAGLRPIWEGKAVSQAMVARSD